MKWREQWDSPKYVFNDSRRERPLNIIDVICSDGYTLQGEEPKPSQGRGKKLGDAFQRFGDALQEAFDRTRANDKPEVTETAPSDKPEVINTRTDLLWYGVDFDGTLARSMWQPGDDISITGDPIWDNVAKLRQVHEAGYKIIIHTARPWSEYENLENWLTHYDIPFKEIQCGKPLYRYYVDDRAIHAGAQSWLPEV